jgi:hypothetical protein
MSKQYGAQQFKDGFALITKNKPLIYSEDGEKKLITLLKHIFASEDLLKGFLDFCTSYIIVQNYGKQIADHTGG